jgi:hypothetical protein
MEKYMDYRDSRNYNTSKRKWQIYNNGDLFLKKWRSVKS